MTGRAPGARIPPPRGRGERFAVIAARYNEAISRKLQEGAVAAFASHGIGGRAVEVHWVPGSFELSQAALALARTRRYDGIVCVGVVIKGETPHFDYVAGAAAQGIARAALETGVPMGFGVITALTEEQAWARAGGAVGNRGEEAALATLEMARWMPGGRSRHSSKGPRDARRAPGRARAESVSAKRSLTSRRTPAAPAQSIPSGEVRKGSEAPAEYEMGKRRKRSRPRQG